MKSNKMGNIVSHLATLSCRVCYPIISSVCYNRMIPSSSSLPSADAGSGISVADRRSRRFVRVYVDLHWWGIYGKCGFCSVLQVWGPTRCYAGTLIGRFGMPQGIILGPLFSGLGFNKVLYWDPLFADLEFHKVYLEPFICRLRVLQGVKLLTFVMATYTVDGYISNY